MMDQVQVRCGPVDRDGKRAVMATLGDKQRVDKFDVASAYHRSRFCQAVIGRFGLPPDAAEWLDSQIFEAAAAEDELPCGLWQPSVSAMADIEAKTTDWLWDGYIPRGAITVIDGDPGLGKSQLTVDLAARVTRGDAMPPLTAPAGTFDPRGALLMNAEDDPARTLRPRLEAAGAVLSRVQGTD